MSISCIIESFINDEVRNNDELNWLKLINFNLNSCPSFYLGWDSIKGDEPQPPANLALTVSIYARFFPEY